MYEYTFHGVQDGDDPPFTHIGTTSDFLELCSQIVMCYEVQVLQNFIGRLFVEKEKEASFLRVVDWNFAYEWDELYLPPVDSDKLSSTRKCKIEVRKVV